MSNPLMGMLGGNAPAQNSMAQMIGMLKNAGNPAAVIQNMAQSDPALKKAMDMCRGKNPQQVFMEQCQAQGINPQQIIGNLK